MLLAKVRTLLAVHFAYMMEYRAEIFFWILGGLVPFFFMAAWSEAARQGYTPYTSLEYARYFFAVFVARQLAIVWANWTFSDWVRTGKLSFYLLQPLDPMWRLLADHVGERGVRLPVLVVIGAIFAVLFPGALVWPGWGALALGLAASALAFLLSFFVAYSVGLLAFWLEDATEIFELWYVLVLFFSGMLAPLSLYPEAVQRVLLWTPFPHLVYLPAALWSGLEPADARGFAVLLVWTLVFFAMSRLLWRLGRGRYSAMGA